MQIKFELVVPEIHIHVHLEPEASSTTSPLPGSSTIAELMDTIKRYQTILDAETAKAQNLKAAVDHTAQERKI